MAEMKPGQLKEACSGGKGGEASSYVLRMMRGWPRKADHRSLCHPSLSPHPRRVTHLCEGSEHDAAADGQQRQHDGDRRDVGEEQRRK